MIMIVFLCVQSSSAVWLWISFALKFSAIQNRSWEHGRSSIITREGWQSWRFKNLEDKEYSVHSVFKEARQQTNQNQKKGFRRIISSWPVSQMWFWWKVAWPGLWMDGGRRGRGGWLSLLSWIVIASSASVVSWLETISGGRKFSKNRLNSFLSSSHKIQYIYIHQTQQLLMMTPLLNTFSSIFSIFRYVQHSLTLLKHFLSLFFHKTNVYISSWKSFNGLHCT